MYKLKQDLCVFSKRTGNVNFANSFLTIYKGYINVKEGFEWNGCTDARDGAIGANGLPSSWIASCVHDALYRSPNCPLPRKTKDLIFYDLLKQVNFKFLGIPASYMYYLGVRIFGGFFAKGEK